MSANADVDRRRALAMVDDFAHWLRTSRGLDAAAVGAALMCVGVNYLKVDPRDPFDLELARGLFSALRDVFQSPGERRN